MAMPYNESGFLIVHVSSMLRAGFIPTCHRRVSAKPIATSIVKSRVYWSVQYWKGMGPVKGTAMRSAGRRHIWAVPNAELRRGKH
eukprot:1138378-Pelagomonas_calceolata.AAC.1